VLAAVRSVRAERIVEVVRWDSPVSGGKSFRS
jgi:hypothetical protein